MSWWGLRPTEPGGRRRLRIGELLVDRGHITRDQLDRALQAQRKQGGDIGAHLLADGELTAYTLYSVLSDQWDAPMLDIAAAPPAPALLQSLSFDEVIRRGWLPVLRDGDTLVIGTTVRPSPELLESAAREFGVRTVIPRTITERDLTSAVSLLYRQPLLFRAAEALAELEPDRSARQSLRLWQKALPVLVGVALVAGLILAPVTTLLVALAAANVAFAGNIGFKVLASLRWPLRHLNDLRWEHDLMRERERRGLPPVRNRRVADKDLPVYSILVPAFHEANVISKVIGNLEQLDYPKTKLDVLILLEEDDVDTIAAAKAARPPHYVRLMVVPRGEPQTKPRACNYGLALARGHYVVIYDAEDRPDSDQLRRVYDEFQRSELEVRAGVEKTPMVCVQCALNYFNAGYNLLTRMFTVEYSHWFDAMLPGLDRTGIPIPLGGTSNHFDTEMLRGLGGWDPYNVTEDADLGMRASAMGYRVGVNSSTTWEEACSQTSAWLKQRTRWIKGYMVTGAVNTRHPIKFWRATGLRGVLCLLVLVIGTPVSFMLYPVVLGLTAISYVNIRPTGFHVPHWLLLISAANLLLGNVSMIVVAGIATWRRHGWRIAVFAVFCPVYWMLHSYAAWRAASQVMFTPHHWEKTPHGLTEDDELDDLVMSETVRR